LDRRLGALVSSLKDMVTQDGVKCRHVRTHFMVADGFTKSMEPHLILEVISTGKVTLQGEIPKKVPVLHAVHAPDSVVAVCRRARKAARKAKKQLKLWK
jgi:hypothetical protein